MTFKVKSYGKMLMVVETGAAHRFVVLFALLLCKHFAEMLIIQILKENKIKIL